MISIGIAEMLAVIFVLVIIYAAYSLLKQLRTLENSQARRILDLMVIGLILYLLDFFLPRELAGQTKILGTAGMLIFLYGFGILLLEKYREGRKEVS